MRVQVLRLPCVVVGDVVEEPFALVVDEAVPPAEMPDWAREMSGITWRQFAEECGARSVIVTPDRVEVVEPDVLGDSADEANVAVWAVEPAGEESPPAEGNMAERVARAFHQSYEELAPSYGYTTRRESAVPWEQVPTANRALMVAVAEKLLAEGVISAGCAC